MKSLRETGDTIVEVLIALTVVASMLGAAYVTSNRSLNNNRQAQERGEALKLAEGQLERLKGLVGSGSVAPFTTTTSFCIDNANAVQPATPANCSIATSGPAYYVTVERLQADHFAVSVSWDKFGGGTSDALTMNYRLHPASTNFATAEPTPPPAPPPAATGTLTCATLGTSSIRLDFTHANATNPSLFRGNTLLQAAGNSPGTATDGGLTAGTGYVYYLRNGNSPSSTALATASCTTTSAASGSISCSFTQFVGMTINYSHSNASSPSIWRGGSYIYNAAASSGSFLDNDSSVMGTGNNITYYLRNGQSGGSEVLSSATCHSTVFYIDWGGIWWPPGMCGTVRCS